MTPNDRRPCRLRRFSPQVSLGLPAMAIVLVATMAGCAALPVAQQARTVRTLRIWYATADPAETPVVQALAHRFQATHMGVKVILTTYGLQDMDDKMQMALGAGDPPDLIYTSPRGPGLPSYVRAGQLRDMAAAARADGWAGSLGAGLLASYNDLLSPTANAAGHVYGVPYVMAIAGILYNKSIMAHLHLSIPTSLAAFQAACARAQRAGVIPLGMGDADGWLGDDWYLTLVNALTGPAPLEPEQRLARTFRFTTPPMVQAATILRNWADQGYFTPQFGGLDSQDALNAFFQGHTAMTLISSTENGEIVALARRTNIPVGIFAFPSVDGSRPAVMPESGYAGWAIPRASHQVALAQEFITQMLSLNTAQTLLAAGLLPARRMTSKSLIGHAEGFQRSYLQAVAGATPGVYLDGAPIPNLNATMEANVQLLLQDLETPGFLTRSLQLVYSSSGARATSTRTDGEF